MLVLTLHPRRRLIIGELPNPIATIELLEVNGNKVRVGIVAPREITVDHEKTAEARMKAKEATKP